MTYLSNLSEFVMKNIILSLIIFLFSLFTYSNTGFNFSANDISFLWSPPIYKTDQQSYIKLSQIVSGIVYSKLINKIEKNTAQAAIFQNEKGLVFEKETHDIRNWYITSFRVDPCAPTLEKSDNLKKCLQEIRFVAQPVIFDSKTINFDDMSMHIIFEISRGIPEKSLKFMQLLRDLRDIKKNTTKYGFNTDEKSLNVYPGIKRLEISQYIAKKILNQLVHFKLKKITFIGANSFFDPWYFVQFTVDKSSVLIEKNKNISNENIQMLKSINNMSQFMIYPKSTNQNWNVFLNENYGPSITELLNLDFTSDTSQFLNKPAMLGNGQPSSVFKNSDIISVMNNPLLSNRENTDCLSCHIATSYGFLFDSKKSQFNYELNQKDVVTTSALDRNLLDLRSFGWFGSKAVVSQRTVNETDAVLKYLNSIFQN